MRKSFLATEYHNRTKVSSIIPHNCAILHFLFIPNEILNQGFNTFTVLRIINCAVI